MKTYFFQSFFALLLLVACGKKIEQYTVTEESITESVYASGSIKSKNQYQVYPKLNGLVEEIFLEEGALVKKGQAILRLTNSASKLNAQTARLAAELANQNTNGEKLKELSAAIELAKIKVRNDSLLWIRQQSLWEKNIGTLVELEQRELAYRSSQNNYVAAKLRYNDTKKQLDFLSEQAKNNAQISNAQDDDFMLRSESDGRVYSILKEQGEMASALSPIAVIGDANSYYIEMQVDEYDITRLEIGQKVVVAMDSYKGQVFEAKVGKINSIMDERTRSFEIEAEFTKAPPKLFPNLSVEANIVIQSKNSALLIPRNYLIADSFVLNQKNEKVYVLTGLKDYKKVEILEGVNKGDVITKPGQ